MTVRTLLKMGDPRLLRVAQPVPDPALPHTQPFLAPLLQDLFDTMAVVHGVGLAAPQIAEDW